MPLATGKIALLSDLKALYKQGSVLTAPEVFAKQKAQAIYTFCKTGLPTTIITTDAGAVAGGVTAGPVKGSGVGGFDSPVPGIGLAAAKDVLKSDLKAVWSHGNKVKPSDQVSQETADAIFKYFSSAKITTKETSNSPLPAPPPAGPVAGSIFGSGGTISDTPGIGFDAAKPTLEKEFTRIWKQIDPKNPRTVDQFAKDVSDAIHAFCIEGIVTTVGTFVAPAVVAPPPAPPVGAYMAGVGTGIGTVM